MLGTSQPAIKISRYFREAMRFPTWCLRRRPVELFPASSPTCQVPRLSARIISYSGGSTTATTNSAGSYTWRLPGHLQRHRLRLPGFLASTQPNLSVTSNSTTTVNFVLAQSGSISGTVTNPQGNRPRQCKLSRTAAALHRYHEFRRRLYPKRCSRHLQRQRVGHWLPEFNSIERLRLRRHNPHRQLQPDPIVGTISGTVTNSAGAAILRGQLSPIAADPRPKPPMRSGSYSRGVAPGTYSVTRHRYRLPEYDPIECHRHCRQHHPPSTLLWCRNRRHCYEHGASRR